MTISNNFHSNAGSSHVLEYSHNLLSRASVTPNDAGCQIWLSEKLSSLGFACFKLNRNGVSNLIAKIGNGHPHFAFAGHTDVVPSGPEECWRVHPFHPQVLGDELVGRGAADMKTAIAAMLSATERYFRAKSTLSGTYYWLITSDEEGEAEFGSKEIAKWLKKKEIKLGMCLVGEPTANLITGDTIKVGRRGAVSAKLSIRGKQGHVAYPQFADNAIHKAQSIIKNLLDIEWDDGSEDFPGTSLQVTHVNSGEFTDNIVPSHCDLHFNIRYSHQYDLPTLKDIIATTLDEYKSDIRIKWERPCEPYFSKARLDGCLITVVEESVRKVTGKFPLVSTSGGTSDGRFYASQDTQVVELGVPNKTIHQANERVHLADLFTLEDIYLETLRRVFDR
ncbi:succinyl-diaminopimelate desuccinylase [Aestuariibacter sp. AA17]|uniref:Succinyl-diaminopimelate desuccinylase n=1 Tax=Fluctibacter corallii TaxID=2984329 RepID=A0ABT3A8N7_9ALTE|nr:succinyl-diaminopimelate desuccinylase [Aestuariibacter sp. AA17]MCV2885042.1 succinyl-diaminopimelate desuccinylase [Aestuariibacter sp. AA17]